MTLLTTTQSVARQVGVFDAPGSIVNNTSVAAVKLLALAEAEGRFLAKKHPWSALIKRFSFNTAASTDSYVITTEVGSDFDRFVTDTLWNSTANDKLVLETRQQAAFDDFGIVGPSGINQRWVKRGNSIVINPTPSAVEAIEGSYVSNEWVSLAASGTATTFAADGDTVLFPEYIWELGIKWRLKQEQGLPYLDDKAEYNEMLSQEIAADGGNTAIFPSPIDMPIVFNIQDGDFPSS